MPLGLKIFIGIMFGIAIGGFVMKLHYDMRIKQEQRFLKSIQNPEAIVIHFQEQKKILSKTESEKFIEELKKKHIGYKNTGRLSKYKVLVNLQLHEDKNYYISLTPDSDYKGVFWMVFESASGTIRIKSSWLMNFFKENNFYDHAKILE
ncbi:MAG: hypothetical protein KAX49_20685 [Halanaerobiales bacterium]|nr:hypothetical protein [Halanaerobiales bacterium]